MSARIDITGQRFGAWVVLGFLGESPTKQGSMWLCRCDCGVERPVKSITLRRGLTKSCGCLKGEKIAKARTKHGHARGGYSRRPSEEVSAVAVGIKKGVHRAKARSIEVRSSRTYLRWEGMKKRTQDRRSYIWRYYGAKGIKFCDRWASYENFLADMGECPPGFSLDRIDPDKDYAPENCRWATYSQQTRQRMLTEVCPTCGKQRQICGGDPSR